MNSNKESSFDSARQVRTQPQSSLPSEVEQARRRHISDAYHNSSREEQEARLFPMRNLSPEVEDERREKISLARKGQQRPREEVLNRSTVWGRIKGLVARGGTSLEIAQITELSSIQVKQAISKNKKRPGWQRVESLGDPEASKQRRSRAQFMRHRKDVNLAELESMNKMAGLLIDAGLVGDDLSFWNGMKSIYSDNQRELPYDISARIILEIFYRAKRVEKKGDSSAVEQFYRVAREIDAYWLESKFSEELTFLNTTDCKHHWLLRDLSEGIVPADCTKCGEHKIYEDKAGSVANRQRARLGSL